MRSITLAEGEHYHVYSRGVGKQKLFRDEADYARMLFLILHLQSPARFLNTKRHIEQYSLQADYGVKAGILERIIKEREVSVVNFCIMPNHFHITLYNNTEKGISRYMHRVQLSYAKYFNTKYDKSGHVFQGTYGAKHIVDNEQLLHLSAYIHKNPKEIALWQKKFEQYPWSSYIDYRNENRWGELLLPEIITEQFKTQEKYAHFVKTSSAKEEV